MNTTLTYGTPCKGFKQADPDISQSLGIVHALSPEQEEWLKRIRSK